MNKTKDTIQQIEDNQLQGSGQILRRENTTTKKEVFNCMLPEGRKRGNPWKDRIMANMGKRI